MPGLVGGHCIGVDPYYLTHKSLEVGYNPEMILAGRKINDNMGFFVAKQISNLMRKKNITMSWLPMEYKWIYLSKQIQQL